MNKVKDINGEELFMFDLYWTSPERDVQGRHFTGEAVLELDLREDVNILDKYRKLYCASAYFDGDWGVMDPYELHWEEIEVWNTYKCIVGDYHNDGHGRYETIVLKTNKSLSQIYSCLSIAKEKLGWDPSKLCSEYGEHTVPSYKVVDLIELGLDTSELLEDDNTIYIDSPEMFINIQLSIAKCVSKDIIKWKFIPDSTESINLGGGYGLFE